MFLVVTNLLDLSVSPVAVFSKVCGEILVMAVEMMKKNTMKLWKLLKGLPKMGKTDIIPHQLILYRNKGRE